MNTAGILGTRGNLGAKVIRAERAPAGWRLRNALRPGYISGLLATKAGRLLSKLTGLPVITSELSLIVYHDGRPIHYGVVGRKMVTTAGVTFLCKDWQDGSTELTNFKYAAMGTTNTAENIADTVMGTEVETRALCTMTNPTGPQVQAVGTITATAPRAIVEHGLFSQLALGGTLWDRTVFAVINLAVGDAIQFTYTVTFTAGG